MKQISLRISDVEKQHLDRYCELTERNQTDVLRQYIRSLGIDGALTPINAPAIPPDTDPSGTVRGS